MSLCVAAPGGVAFAVGFKIQRVVAGTACVLVGSLAAPERVVAVFAIELVVSGIPEQGVVARRLAGVAAEAADEDVVAVAAADGVIAAARPDLVVAEPPPSRRLAVLLPMIVSAPELPIAFSIETRTSTPVLAPFASPTGVVAPASPPASISAAKVVGSPVIAWPERSCAVRSILRPPLVAE